MGIPQVTREVQRIAMDGEVMTVATYQTDAPYRVEKDAEGCYHIWSHDETRWPVGAANNLETAMFLWAGTIQDLDAAKAEITRLSGGGTEGSGT